MRRPAKVLLWLAVWTVIGLFFTTQLILIRANLYHQSITWRHALWGTMPNWYLWFLLTPAVLWMSRAFPIERATWPRAALVHLSGGSLIALVHVSTYTALTH